MSGNLLIRDALKLAWGANELFTDLVSKLESCNKVTDTESEAHDGLRVTTSISSEWRKISVCPETAEGFASSLAMHILGIFTRRLREPCLQILTVRTGSGWLCKKPYKVVRFGASSENWMELPLNSKFITGGSGDMDIRE